MALNIQDDRGFNQGFKMTPSMEIRMKRRADFMINNMDVNPNQSVLEIGCGRGEISFWVADKTKKQVIGSDLCEPFIQQALNQYKLPNLDYQILNFNSVPANSMKFDYIIGNGILHHLYYNLDTAIENLKNLLNQNGKIIFIEPNIYNPYITAIFKIPFLRKIANLEPDEMAFSPSFITNKLTITNFHNIQVSYKDFLIPGIPLALVKPIIFLERFAEQIPIIKNLSQSLFIVAQKAK